MIKSRKPLEFKDDRLFILDQRELPNTETVIEIKSIDDAYDAIKSLAVRGAPAIGVAAAYSIIAISKVDTFLDVERFKQQLLQYIDILKSSRPTAVNLFYTLDRLKYIVLSDISLTALSLYEKLRNEAIAIHDEDINICRKIGSFGAELIKDGAAVLTHCNAGSLATSDIGTALAPIYTAQSLGKRVKVFADETRPLLQGSRLTAYELMKNGVDTTLLCDSMAASLISKGLVDMIIIGCDRVARNGDTANKIGSLPLAVCASYYKVPFYVAMPSSTYDISSATGADIVIEERQAEEVAVIAGKRIAPGWVKVYNPSFDVTPHELITAFITDKGVLAKPFERTLKLLR